jgi:hypothetical protein
MSLDEFSVIQDLFNASIYPIYYLKVPLKFLCFRQNTCVAAASNRDFWRSKPISVERYINILGRGGRNIWQNS